MEEDKIKFCFCFGKINHLTLIKFFVIHDLLWSILYLALGGSLLFEVVSFRLHVDLLTKNKNIVQYALIGVGGFFFIFSLINTIQACRLNKNSNLLNSGKVNFIKKTYFGFRMFFAFVHLLILSACLVLVILIRQKSLEKVKKAGIQQQTISDVENNFLLLTLICSFSVAYSIFNTISSVNIWKSINRIYGIENNDELEMVSPDFRTKKHKKWWGDEDANIHHIAETPQIVRRKSNFIDEMIVNDVQKKM